jgi:hypothetical protein
MGRTMECCNFTEPLSMSIYIWSIKLWIDTTDPLILWTSRGSGFALPPSTFRGARSGLGQVSTMIRDDRQFDPG